MMEIGNHLQRPMILLDDGIQRLMALPLSVLTIMRIRNGYHLPLYLGSLLLHYLMTLTTTWRRMPRLEEKP